MSRPEKSSRKIIINNKKARFQYLLLETFEAGLVLKGCEVKSLRNGAATFTDAYCRIQNDEVWLIGLHIKQYPQATSFRPEPARKRKLLLRRHEINRLHKKVSQAGLTLVPLSLYFTRGIAKVEAALAKGKKIHDKRQSMKERDAKRQIRHYKS